MLKKLKKQRKESYAVGNERIVSMMSSTVASAVVRRKAV